MTDRSSGTTGPQPHQYNGFLHDGVPTLAVIAALRRRWKLVAGAVMLTTSAAVVVVLHEEPAYRATAVLRVADTRQAVSAAIDLPQANPAADRRFDPVFSQLHLLQSRTVLAQVVEEEGLRLQAVAAGLPVDRLRNAHVGPAVTADTLWLSFSRAGYGGRTDAGATAAAYGERVSVAGISFSVDARPAVPHAVFAVLPEQTAIDRVRERLRAKSRAQTEIIDLSYTAATPHEAQRVVNATARVFEQIDATRARTQARRQAVFLASQVVKIDSMLAESQRELSDFRAREELISSREKLVAQQSAVLQLEMRLGELRAEAQQVRTFVAQLQDGSSSGRRDALRTVVSSPAVAANSVVMQLHGQLVRYEASRDSLTGGAWGRAATDGDVVRLGEMIAATQRQLVQALEGHSAVLDARIAALDSLRLRSMAALQALPPKEANELRLAQQVASAQRMSEQLSEELQKARMAEALEGGQVEVVDWAALPYAPVESWPSLKLLLGALLGLMLGGSGAGVLEFRRSAIRERADLEALLGTPTLAMIPRLDELARWGRRSSTRRMGGIRQPAGTLPELGRAEPYRALGVSLRYARSGQLKTLVVTSALPGEGKSTTSTHLALAAARSGRRILLVDCDLHRPSLHDAFGVPVMPGLLQMLTDNGNGLDAIRPTSVERLSILTSGTTGGRSADIALNGNMSRLLERLAPRFDWIILDTPPLLAVSDSASLAALADGVLLVVRAGSTERAVLQDARQQLELVGANIVGTVLNDPDRELPGYTRSRYRYYEDTSRGPAHEG